MLPFQGLSSVLGDHVLNDVPLSLTWQADHTELVGEHQVIQEMTSAL